jgi:hypothetical protein
VNKAAKYYSLIFISYLIELYLFNFLQFIENISPEMINFLVRLFMVIFSAGLLRILVFREGKNFFKIFFFLSLVNPLISSVSLLFLFGIMKVDLIIAKIIGDVFTSLLLFYVLKILLKKHSI